MICACCGFEIKGKMHRINSGYVCDRCWKDPNNFFPEKMQNSERWIKFSRMLKSENQGTITVPVIKIKQKNITLYAGKLKSRDLLKMYSVCGFDDETFSGYQREPYEEKINDIYEYLIKCPIAIMPAIFISLRSRARFKPIYRSDLNNDDIGTLSIPLKKGSIWIIDGQHRVGSFEKVLGNIVYFEDSPSSKNDEFFELMEYELPVIFLDSRKATDFFNHSKQIKTNPVSIERTIFFIINKTQNRISPSLKDALQYSIKKDGINGIPIIEREKWRTEAVSLVIKLNGVEESPFFDKINISGARGINRPIQLNSFVSSLKPLFMDPTFLEFNFDEKLKLLLIFWKTIKKMNPKAFSKDSYKEYLILKTIGIYSLNLLCSDYLKWCKMHNRKFLDKNNIETFLNPIKAFDWNRSTSPVSYFGGLSGVREVHSILLQRIKEDIIY